MQILDGKIVAQAVKDVIKIKTEAAINAGKKTPHLAAILIGSNGASETYVASKVRSCEEVGFKSSLIRLPENVEEATLVSTIEQLNGDADVDGILVQLPLPKQISEAKIISLIHPDKDVDGFHPMSVGKMVQGLPTFIPATPYGILLMLEHYKIDTKGKHAVVIGRSNIVGKPMALMLLQKNATVTICHSATPDLKAMTLQADVIVAAVGKRNVLTADMVKPGAVVLDVGMNRNDEGKLCGDVDFDGVKEVASYITPVPGGVGPMTITMLLVNTLEAAETSAANAH